MKNAIRIPSVLILVVTALTASATAQWINYPTPGTPRLSNGKVNLSAPAPRLNGKPDLSGVWHVEPTPMAEWVRMLGPDPDPFAVPGMELTSVSKYAANVFADFAPGTEPIRPEVAQEMAAMVERRLTSKEYHPGFYCLPYGIPVSSLLSGVTKFVQTPNLTIVLLETGGNRQIYTDGRKHMPDNNPSWFGYSTGKWEGDTLVVETIGFNGRTWLDVVGRPQSEEARVTERFRRRDFGHLDAEVTFNDPVWYSKPFTIKVTYLLQPDTDILEYYCENEKDHAHLPKAEVK
ncbi:MAG TPA: hypothetical protein VFY29_05280 [Terriglobia bacterium]|nr:hypothetical protein [Terriglobia bacterium]